MSRLTAPPLALYVHLPWCVRKCPYCDFNSHQLDGRPPEQAYVQALLEDLEHDLPAVWGRTIHTVFLGGGTPSLFSPAAIETLLAGVAARVPLHPGAEVTMEINPGTVEHAPLVEYRAAGITRASLGVQSFSSAALQRLGRIHDAAQAQSAAREALAAGFDSVNLDLMFGLPGQTVEEALDDVRQALDLAPAHLSHYQLTLEPNTLFHRFPPELPDDEACWYMQGGCAELLAGAGYQQYEVSAWARPGSECRHNLNYWRFGDYLGIGAGAHAKLTVAARGEIVRMVRERHPRRYLQSRTRVVDQRVLDAADRAFEFMLNHLRLREALPFRRFEQRTGLAVSTVRDAMDQGVVRGWLRCGDDHAEVTDLGWNFLNDVQALFVPRSAARHAG